jgi:gamma-glutamyltranspeptidase/glutathione hydrolase
MTEAERRAYKDRAAYLGDGDFSNIPVAKLTSDSYLKEQMSNYTPGKAGVSQPIGTGMQQPESKETTHFSIVDKDGNAVSVTTTLNTSYGSQVVVGGAGFLLNNEMNDFSIKAGARTAAAGGVGGIANSIEPGKRMLSSMTPTIILKDGRLFMVVGSPGGTTIPTSVFQTIVDIVDFKMTAADAVNKPKFHHEWLPDVIEMEDSAFPPEAITELKKMGYVIQGASLGRVELIKVREDGNLDIVADSRASADSAEGY